MKTFFDTLIVGGGMTGAAAARGLREAGDNGTVGIIGAEPRAPYNRPPLSKKLWQGKPEASIWSELPGQGVAFISGCRVARLDAQNKRVFDEQGSAYDYGRLLLATGGEPRTLPFAPPETCYFRTLDDYHTVRSWAQPGARIGIIGGGFIGSEVAASLAQTGARPVMVFPEEGIGARIFPAEVARFLNDYYHERNVEVKNGLQIEGIERQRDGFLLRARDGAQVAVDHIVAGIGIRPAVGLAQSAGLRIAAPEEGGGILVDENLRSSAPEIYAAGDVASFYNPALGKVMRVEHADNALEMGRSAGMNMAGQPEPYHHLPFFYSDLFDLGYEAVGELDPRMEIIRDWQEPLRKGVLYYTLEGRVRGVLLWNVWDQVEAARALIREGRAWRPEELKGRLMG